MKERIARLERGDDAPLDLKEPQSLDEALLAAGFTKRELRDLQEGAALLEGFSEETRERFLEELEPLGRATLDAACRKIRRLRMRALAYLQAMRQAGAFDADAEARKAKAQAAE